MSPLIRPLLITAGTISVALGIVGMFIPFLPTTPFLLLAAACYARSSDKFLHWLLHNRWLGTYVQNYRDGRGMPRTTKILTLLALWITLGFSVLFAATSWWVRLLLFVIGIGVSIHLLRLKTYVVGQGAEGSLAHCLPSTPPDEL